MAGGKLTPRQKMINLMYLVFIAMLALNMSKEVLSAFGILNNKIVESNSIADVRNDSSFQQLAQKAQDQPLQFGAKKEKVEKIRALCKEYTTYIEKLKTERAYDDIIYLTPDGKTFHQKMANTLSLQENLMMICGHYKGIDQRIRDLYVTMEISIGDYVLSGGELAAAILVDSIGRLIPGVLNDETSALTDSHQDGLLAPPVYTRPAEFKGLKVPEVLLNGHFKMIEEWRQEEALKRTAERRPDLME